MKYFQDLSKKKGFTGEKEEKKHGTFAAFLTSVSAFSPMTFGRCRLLTLQSVLSPEELNTA